MAIVPHPSSALILPRVLNTGSPASWQVALFRRDPDDGGLELAATGGYARATLANGAGAFDFDGGVAYQTAVFAASTGEWPQPGRWVALVDPASPSVYWFPQELADPVVVHAAGVSPRVRVRCLFARPGVAVE